MTSSTTRIEVLRRYLEEDPGDTFLHYALALEFIGLNDYKQAYPILEKLLSDDPDYLPGYYMAGKVCEALLQNEKAGFWYSKGMLVAENQKNAQTLNELRSALESLDD